MVFMNSLKKHCARFNDYFISLSKPQSLLSNIRLESISCPLLSVEYQSLVYRNHSFCRNMSSGTCSVFDGKRDYYNGIIVDCDSVPQDGVPFDKRLGESLKKWKEENVRGVWFNVSTKYADWIPILVKNDFNFHHASIDQSTVTLSRWLPQQEGSNIPQFSHTMVGIGAIVVNDANEILAVKEKYGPKIQWKLPGGYVEPGEDLADAVVREVMEETHIETKFVSIVAFRHMHKVKFGCSDFYFIAHLVPLSKNIEKCNREIEDCTWMKIEEYLNHPEVHINNKFFVEKYLENSKNKVALIGKKTLHPNSKKEQYIFAIESST